MFESLPSRFWSPNPHRQALHSLKSASRCKLAQLLLLLSNPQQLASGFSLLFCVRIQLVSICPIQLSSHHHLPIVCTILLLSSVVLLGSEVLLRVNLLGHIPLQMTQGAFHPLVPCHLIIQRELLELLESLELLHISELKACHFYYYIINLIINVARTFYLEWFLSFAAYILTTEVFALLLLVGR